MIKIANYSFEGPHSSTDSLADRSGVYVILAQRPDGLHVLDCGESATVKTRVANHDRADQWKRHAQGALKVAVYYTPNLQQSGRMQVEQAIRTEYNPPCGDR